MKAGYSLSTTLITPAQISKTSAPIVSSLARSGKSYAISTALISSTSTNFKNLYLLLQEFIRINIGPNFISSILLTNPNKRIPTSFSSPDERNLILILGPLLILNPTSMQSIPSLSRIVYSTLFLSNSCFISSKDLCIIFLFFLIVVSLFRTNTLDYYIVYCSPFTKSLNILRSILPLYITASNTCTNTSHWGSTYLNKVMQNSNFLSSRGPNTSYGLFVLSSNNSLQFSLSFTPGIESSIYLFVSSKF